MNNNKRIITKEEIDKINDLNDSVKGTDKYTKYYLYSQSNWKNDDGKWVGWKAGYWVNGIYSNRLLTVKIVKDKIYLVSEEYVVWDRVNKDRYEVPKTLMEVLGL